MYNVYMYIYIYTYMTIYIYIHPIPYISIYHLLKYPPPSSPTAAPFCNARSLGPRVADSEFDHISIPDLQTVKGWREQRWFWEVSMYSMSDW